MGIELNIFYIFRIYGYDRFVEINVLVSFFGISRFIGMLFGKFFGFMDILFGNFSKFMSGNFTI